MSNIYLKSNYFGVWENMLFNTYLFYLYEDYKRNENNFNVQYDIVASGNNVIPPVPLKWFMEASENIMHSIKNNVYIAPLFFKATEMTNFRYKLSHALPMEKVGQINAMVDDKGHADIQGRVRAILSEGISLEFDSIAPNKNGEYIFYENLLLIDSSMPEILGHLLVASYTENSRLLDVLTEKLTTDNPIHFPMKTNKKYYEAKVKRFITDVALGMLPSQPWEAAHQSTGILVVKESGDIDCYHVIYRSALEDYLYHDLKFETPSVSRHGFGVIETDDEGNQFFTLNLQLRFLK